MSDTMTVYIPLLYIFLSVSQAWDLTGSFPSCLESGVTWDQSGMLDIVPDTATPEECQYLCSTDQTCTNFTWYSSSLVCSLYSNCEAAQPCEACVSGPAQCLCTVLGGCVDTGENVLQTHANVASVMDCSLLCADTPHCTTYTYFTESHHLYQFCLLFSSCPSLEEECTGCTSGVARCQMCSWEDTQYDTCGMENTPDLLFLGNRAVLLPSFEPYNCEIPEHPIEGLHSSMIGVINNEKLIRCGGESGSYPDEIYHSECFSLQPGGWVEEPPMTQVRDVSGSSVIGSQFWITGGYDGGSILTSTEYYQDGQWTSGPDLPVPSYVHCQVSLDGTIMVTGGSPGGGYQHNSLYKLEGSTWTPLPPMNQARYGHACTVWRGNIVVLGGDGDASSVEIYNVSTSQWSYTTPLPAEYYGFRGHSFVYDDLLYFFTQYGSVIKMNEQEEWEPVAEIGHIDYRGFSITKPAGLGC